MKRSLSLLPVLVLALCGAGAWPPAAKAVDSLVVVGLFRDMAIVKVDGAQYTLEKGEATPEGVRLIAADSEQATLDVDGAVGTYELGSHIAGRFQPAEGGATVKIVPDRMGMYYVSGSINGFGTRFLVDTGATHVAMNRNEAKRLGIPYKLEGLEGRTNTASGVTKAYYVTLDRVRVGGIEVRNVSAAIIDGDFPTEILLGNSFLGRLDMDREGRLMTLRKP